MFNIDSTCHNMEECSSNFKKQFPDLKQIHHHQHNHLLIFPEDEINRKNITILSEFLRIGDKVEAIVTIQKIDFKLMIF